MGIANLLGLDVVREEWAGMWGGLGDDLRGIWYQAIKRKPPPASHYMPVKLRQSIISRDGHRCRYCGMYGDEDRGADGTPWHIDHVMPLALGGRTVARNLVLSCAPCNLQKGDRIAFPNY